ncbi:hypothetical protein HJC23_007842 [Cyclotella cryptica]|uniref:Uncharacterized protein n=1 Tax=Cyclotella cryptica TaxID=29204 RepID=A0ABD3R3L6_9STRA|eukprot:CCRYP_000152-RA/>CCRYP_000152-RA protein AED:0.35 eAED:0.35 QI:93/-1/1/1/-1/1/1/41/326
MLVVLLTLWMWVGYLMGFVSLVVSQSTLHDAPSSTTPIDPELFAKAITHAKTMAITNDPNHRQHIQQHQQLLDQLQSGNIEALYTVAQSLNQRGAGDDRITSVQLWHALADGPAAHVLSAVALGFSYAEVDKELALKYFVQAAQGKGDGGPHQAAAFNAGRLFLELNDAASSLAYIRACANVHNQFPAYATPQLTQTCQEAYETLSLHIRQETTSPPGIEDAAEMFLYSSIDEFPEPNSKEFAMWARGMEYLEMYATLVREGNARGEISGNKKGQTYLLAAQQELEHMKSGYGKNMSELQHYLIDIILGRVQVLMTAMESEDGYEL